MRVRVRVRVRVEEGVQCSAVLRQLTLIIGRVRVRVRASVRGRVGPGLGLAIWV